MSRGSLNDAVRAAGYAMATSEELLDFGNPTVIMRRPDGRDRQAPKEAPQPAQPPFNATEPRSFRTFFGSLAVWA